MTIIAGYRVDIVIREEYRFPTTPSRHPLEGGAATTDHIVLEPKRIILECVVSDTPVGVVAELRRRNGFLSEVGAGLDGLSPSDDAFQFFTKLWKEREPFSVTVGRGTFHNMFVRDLTNPQTVDDGDSLHFTVDLQEFTFVTNERTTIEVERPRSKRKRRRGNKPSKTVDVGSGPDGAPKRNNDTLLRSLAQDAVKWNPGNFFGLD